MSRQVVMPIGHSVPLERPEFPFDVFTKGGEYVNSYASRAEAEEFVNSPESFKDDVLCPIPAEWIGQLEVRENLEEGK